MIIIIIWGGTACAAADRSATICHTYILLVWYTSFIIEIYLYLLRICLLYLRAFINDLYLCIYWNGIHVIYYLYLLYLYFAWSIDWIIYIKWWIFYKWLIFINVYSLIGFVYTTGLFPRVGGGAGLCVGRGGAKALVEAFGGRVASAVSNTTHALLVGQDPAFGAVIII
jgi:hypothetical protein